MWLRRSEFADGSIGSSVSEGAGAWRLESQRHGVTPATCGAVLCKNIGITVPEDARIPELQ